MADSVTPAFAANQLRFGMGTLDGQMCASGQLGAAAIEAMEQIIKCHGNRENYDNPIYCSECGPAIEAYRSVPKKPVEEDESDDRIP